VAAGGDGRDLEGVLAKGAVEVGFAADDDVFGIEEGTLVEGLVFGEVQWLVAGCEAGLGEVEVGVLDEEEAAGFEFDVEEAETFFESLKGEAVADDAVVEVSIFGALEDGHAEDGVEGASNGKLRGMGLDEGQVGVGIAAAALFQAPAIDVDAEDEGVGELAGERKDFFAGGAAKGEDGGGVEILEVFTAGFEELGVAIGCGEGGSLKVEIAVEYAGEYLRPHAGAEDESAAGSEGPEHACERSKDRAR